jgi:four helix bundle protein
MTINNFQDLDIWKDSLVVAKLIYDLTLVGGFNKDFALRDQIRRAIISVSSNIAEGFERNNNNEFVYFLRVAKGSLGEVRSQLYIAELAGYVDISVRVNIVEQVTKLSSQIGAFIVYLDKYRKEDKV